MNANGRDCSLFLTIGSQILSLPYSTETLRDVPALIRREASIGEERGSTTIAATGAAGCVVTPLTITNAPILLTLAFGEEAPTIWESQTRSLFRHDLTQRYLSGEPTFEVIQDRVASAKRYRSLHCTGYELRGTAGGLLALKLDIAGNQGSEDAGYYLKPMIPQEELFRFDEATLFVNGERCTGFYAFSLSVKKDASRKGAEIALHTTVSENNARLLSARTIERVDLDFPLRNTYYEAGRIGRFAIRTEGLILRADEITVDCADELIGPRRFIINGALSAQVFTADEERLLP